MKNLIKTMIAAGMILGLQSAYAAPLTIPNTFTANSPAVAADVNTNFTAAKAAVDDNDARITALETQIAALQVVTDTNNGVLTLQKAAGNWAMVSNTFGYLVPGAGVVEFNRDVKYGTVIVNADGTFTVTFNGGSEVIAALNAAPGLTGTFTNRTSGAVGSTFNGVFTNTGNNLTATVTVPGLGNINMVGFISQNGQVIIMKSDAGSVNSNESMMMIKIN